MSGKIGMILTGTFTLVAIYLFLSNSGGTVKIISQLGSTYTSGVKTLQGRWFVWLILKKTINSF